MNENAIEVEALRKVFPGGVAALDGLDLSVPSGTLFGLLGRNGAGKTTLLRILAGILRADSGDVRVLGRDPLAADAAHRARTTYAAQIPNLTARYSLGEHARYLGYFHPRFDHDLAHALARRFDTDWDKKVARLSGGAQRKAAVVLALAARPDLLLLDEPGAGLDAVARRDLTSVLVDVLGNGDGTTILLSTHLIGDLERLAEHVGIVDGGRLQVAAPLEELKERFRRVQVVFEGAPPPTFAIPGALRTERSGSVVTAVARLDDRDALAPVFAAPGARVELFALDLEQIFLALAGPPADADRNAVPEEVRSR